MSNSTKLDSRNVVQKVPLNRLAPNAGPDPDRVELDNILSSVDSQITPPLEMRASEPADSVLNIGAITLQDPENNFWRTIPPISNLLPDISSLTVTFPTTSGGNATPSSGDAIVITITSGNFLKVGINLDPNGDLVLQAGTEGASIAAATAPPLVSGTFPIGYVVLENQGGTIQTIENEDIYQYVGGGGGGSGSGDASTVGDFISDYHEASPYSLANSTVYSRDADDNVDGASTAAYSLVTGTIQFTAGSQTLITNQLLDLTELDEDGLEDVSTVDLLVFWKEGAIDTAATYELSRDGGNEYQAVTMERVGGTTGAYRGSLTFAEEAANQSLVANATTDGNQELDATSNEALAEEVTLANDSVVNELSFGITVTGSPTGFAYARIYSDNAGTPDEILSESDAIDISALTTGTLNVSMPDVALEAGTYHVALFTDATYKSGFSTGVTSIAINTNSGGSNGETFDGSTWSSAAFGLVYDVQGRELELKLRITSSAGDVEVDGHSVHYDIQPGRIATGEKNVHTEEFMSNSDNEDTFALPFLPEPDLLRVYHLGTGQVFRHDPTGELGFKLDGFNVVFNANTFQQESDQLVKLVFDQTNGGSFDNSDENTLDIADLERRLTPFTKNSNYTAVAGDQILADTSTAAFTVTLPVSPVVGNRVTIYDMKISFTSNNLTVGRNGSNIESLAENMDLDLPNGKKYEFIYVDSTIGWRLFV